MEFRSRKNLLKFRGLVWGDGRKSLVIKKRDDGSC